MRFPKSFAALLLALLLPITALPATAQADAQLAEAQRLFKDGQYPQALAKADAHIASRPKDPQGRFFKGLILAEMKRTPEAIAVFRKLTEDFPELPEPYNNLAVLYAQEKQYDRARQALEAAIKTHPSYAVAHENLGDVYSKLASQAYGKALQLDSNNPTAQNKLALIRDLISVTARQSSRPPAEPLVKPLAALTPPPVVASPPAKPTAAAPPETPRTGAPAATRPVVAATPAPAPAPAPATSSAATAPSASPPTSSDSPKATPAAPAAATKASAAPPAAPATPAASAPTAATPDAGKAVQAWATAWSRKDVTAYLSAYAPEFVPPGGLNRAAWESERKARLTKPGAIEVGVDRLEVTLQGGDRATAKFRQNYKSANLKTSAGKTLLLVRSNGRWLIKEERVN